MTQTKVGSLMEATANTLSGFVLSYFLQEFICWLLELPVSHGENLLIVLAFTILSLTRTYFWRRYFNKLIHKTIIRK